MIDQIKGPQMTSINRVQNSNQKTSTDKNEKAAPILSDRVEIGKTQQPSGVYAKPEPQKANATDLNAIKEQVERATENLRKLVEDLILNQGHTKGSSKKSTFFGDEKTMEQAKTAISEDGEFGVKAVSDRIVDFAKAISGGDKSKLEELKSAIDKGFAQAEKTFGGKLPDISYQTRDEIMKKLDAWGRE